MKLLFALFLGLHGLLHLLGAAKGLGLADVAQLTQPITRPEGVLWLLAAVLILATAVSLFVLPRWWILIGISALILSQLAISFSWADAGYGTIPNIILLAGLVLGFLSSGPRSFRAEYNREVAQDLARSVPTPLLTEADLVHLPAMVQRYIRRSGAVGLPKVQNFSARYHGQIRSGPDSSWMSFTGRQHNAYDRPSRLFLMDASKSGVPFQAFHRFVGPSATMRVKVASLVTLVNAAGPEMDEAETVTLFNDLCVLAPGALIAGSIRWREIDDKSVEASFTNAGRTIHAILSFNELGELINFVADGRGASSSDGRSFTKMGWSTPLTAYRSFGAHRLMGSGEGIWHAPAGNYSYLRFVLDSIEYNVARPPLLSGWPPV